MSSDLCTAPPSSTNNASSMNEPGLVLEVVDRSVTPPLNQQNPPPESPNPQGASRVNINGDDIGNMEGGVTSVVIPVGSNDAHFDTTSANTTVLRRGHCLRRTSQSASGSLRATVRERNAAVLFNESMADVWFRVGPIDKAERIPAHSYVLATGSSVFYAMFFGNFEKSSDIHIPDVQIQAFKTLLKYLYTDEMELNTENVLSVLYCAKKYLVSHLTACCIQFLESSLNAGNVCLLLTQGIMFEEDKLIQRCWELIDAQTELSLRSDGFFDLDLQTLNTLLSRDSLSVNESFLFKAAINWAKSSCAAKEILESPENFRKELGSAFYQLRLACMKVEEFADGPAQSGVLQAQETTDIFLYLTATNKPRIEFVTSPRTGLPVRKCHRFSSSAYRSNQWRYRGRCDSIQFCSDKGIFVIGLGLYGSSNGAADYKVQIELKRAGQTLSYAAARLFCDGSSDVFPVYFKHPVQIEADVFYTASAVLDGDQLSFFGQEGNPEVQCDQVTFLFQCSTESTNGTGVQGGQIPEILFYSA